MNAAQKFAWFNLAVIAATLITVLALIPFLRHGALGGLGLLGLLGIGPLLLRRKGGGRVWDERDQVIALRSLIAAYTVFWLMIVASCTSLPMIYGSRGEVPVAVVQWSVFVAVMLVVGVTSLATLIQYGREGATGEV
jgi:hypothetical protein